MGKKLVCEPNHQSEAGSTQTEPVKNQQKYSKPVITPGQQTGSSQTFFDFCWLIKPCKIQSHKPCDKSIKSPDFSFGKRSTNSLKVKPVLIFIF